jgi:isocitrate dehydrogenase
MTGSVGLVGSANIGDTCSMFEAIHGSAPRRAGQNIANPSALLLGAVMMLVHIGQTDIASKVHNAWLKTIEDGLHTYDIYKEGLSKKKMGTREFGQAVVDRLGDVPKTLKAAEYKPVETKSIKYKFQTMPKAKKELVGVDVYVDWAGGTPDDLGGKLSKIKADGLKLTLISNRGLEVWPGGQSETFCVDHWRCRFETASKGSPATHEQIITLLRLIKDAGYDFIKTENLYNFDGVAGYSTTKG